MARKAIAICKLARGPTLIARYWYIAVRKNYTTNFHIIQELKDEGQEIWVNTYSSYLPGCWTTLAKILNQNEATITDYGAGMGGKHGYIGHNDCDQIRALNICAF
ncbi:uncharacterized protein MELLADRAFT_103246 [Melampsora larici-populina 98AG31]|uniref:Uncharacterized protein n=1 Tax=Melampsora larici-populina (strain 98AG31 / pathotype 3-4-7) TaxID=747676 RepID=F4RB07_MELLP|nr:uncharacterized protein MELLADRAFT_103246 [Melampsora larici-populina 98AG31]EGG10566.1 hypothetical protein MELLADRAFT_103246 [Melampsora larici-populina 98AG31]